MPSGPDLKQFLFFTNIRKLAVLGLLLIFQIQLGCGGGRGGGVDADGNSVGVGLLVNIVSGNNQGVKKGLPFPVPIVARVDSPDGTPVPEMNVTCQETSNTDGYISGPTTFYTDTSGIVSTTVFAPSTYDVIMTIECAINGTPNKAVFTLETVFIVDYLQWSGGNQPPNTHTVHDITPISAFQVEMIDTDGFLIDLTGGTRHWIDVSMVETGIPAARGTTRATFTLGVANFADVRCIRAGNYTLRATHNRSGKYIEKLMTFNPNVTTKAIARLPGQAHYPGVMTLAEAFTGALTALDVDNTFNVQLIATDDYFNQTTYAGVAALTTPTDIVDTEPGASVFVAGSETMIVSPVQAKSGWIVRPTTALTNHDSTSFTMNAGAASQLITVLPNQTFVPGQTVITNAITGVPTTQVAGVPFNVTVRATDAEFNQVTTTPTVALATSDGADTNPANQALVSGTSSFSITNITAGTAHTMTATSGGYGANVSTTYTVVHNAASQMVVTTQPAASIIAGVEIAPVVEIRDFYGNIVNSGVDATALVTLSLFSGTGALAGTLTKASVAGVADFTGLGAYINLIGTKVIRLTKTSTAAGGGTAAITVNTNSFLITHGPANNVAWTTNPASPTGAGVTFNAAVEVRDQFGNVVTSGVDSTASISLAIQSGTGVLAGTASKAPTAGVVSFAAAEGLNIVLRGYKTLRATKPNTSASGGTAAITGDSNNFQIIHGPATQVTWVTEPTSPTVAGTNLLPVVEVQDVYGNLVDSGVDAAVNISLAIQTGTMGATLSGTKVLAATSGRATWTAAEILRLDLVGAFVLRASKPSTVGSGGTAAFTRDTASFTVNHAPASLLVWSTQPTTPTVAGINITPTIEIRDPYGNVVTTSDDSSADITLSLSAGSGTLNGTVTKAASSGVVSFTAAEVVNITVAGVKTLTAYKSDESAGTGVGVLSANSSAFTIRHAAATQFAYTTQPANPTAAGANILPVLAIQDTYGNVVNTGGDATAVVTLSLQVGSGALTGTLTKAAVNGVATFAAAEAVRITTAGAKTLRATKSNQVASGGVAPFTGDSASFTIVNAPATTLVWTSQPANPTGAGVNMTPVIEIRDTYGNVVTSDDDATALVTLSIISGSGTLNGTVTRAAIAGVATFTAAEAVNITVTGMKTLQASKASTATGTGVGVLTQNSNAFLLTHGPASQMVWTTQPTSPTGAGVDIIPVIAIRDSYGNLVNTGDDATADVTLSLQTGSGPLNGTLVRTAVNGVATFTGADNINIEVTGYKTLRATKSDESAGTGVGVLTQNSDSFLIKNAPATTLVWTTQPSNPTLAGANITPVISIRDTFGNVVVDDSDATALVTLSLISGSGALNGTLTKAAVAGIATFTAAEIINITVTGVKTLSASKASTVTGTGVGVLTQNSSVFTVQNAPASQLVWSTQPANPTVAGTDILPVIQIRDTYNNIVTADDDATAAITLSIQSGSGSLNGTVTKLATAGVVSFTAAESVDITVSGPKTLTATKSNQSFGTGVGALAANSSGFVIDPAAATQVVWSTSPTSPTAAGVDLLPVIEIRDTYGNVKTNTDDATAEITLTIQTGTGGATLSGTKVLRVSGGTVTWAAAQSLDIDLVGAYTLRATKQNMSAGTGVGALTGDSASFNIVPNAATNLVWSTQPTNPTTAGANITPVIEVRDAYTNVVTNSADATAAITLSLLTGSGSLNGTVTKLAAAGIVNFTAAEAVNIQITGFKTLRATKSDQTFSTGVGVLTASSNSFQIAHAAANKLVWTVQPADPTVAQADITPTIQVQDTYNNIITSGPDATAAITLSTQSGSGALNGTLLKQATAGVVAFGAAESVDYIVTGPKTLTATKAATGGVGVLTQNSTGFTVNNSAATTLVWTTSPADPTIAGADLLPVIAIRDTHGNIVTTTADATAVVTLSIAAGSGTLNGTVALAAVSGLVTFTAAQSIDFTVTGVKTLTASKAATSGSGILTANSSPFTINNSPATAIVFTTQPANPTAAAADLLPVLEIRDTYANIVTTTSDATALVTLSLAAGSGPLNGTLTKAAVNGVVSFTAAQSVDIAVTGWKTITATKADTSSGTGVGTLAVNSNAFKIKNSPATTLVWTTQPSNPTIAGADILPVIEIRDTNSNVVTDDDDASADISLSIISGTGSLFGTVTKAAVNGIVTFTAAESVDIRTTGIKTLRATKSDESTGTGVGVLTQNSNLFLVNNAPATQLVYTTAPTNPTVAGTNLVPVIEIRDTYNNIVTTTDDSNADITLSLSSGTGTLAGTVMRTAVNGIATFVNGDGVNITTAGNKIITAWKSDETGGTGVGPLSVATSTFEIRHSTPTAIAFTSQPPNPSTANVEIAMIVTVQDTYGNPVNTGVDSSANITISLAAGTGTLGGTTTKDAVAGVADFSGTGINIDTVGMKTVRAGKANTTGSGGTAAMIVNSNPFNLIPGIASQVFFSTEPVTTAAGANIVPVVQIRDVANNVVATGIDSTAMITLSLFSGTGSLLGTLNKQAVAGVATFSASEAVNMTSPGVKKITATKQDLSAGGATGAFSVNSADFTITNAAATTLVYTTQPTNPTAAGADLNPVIEIRDTYGNVVNTGVDATAAITLSVLAGSGSLNGTVLKQAAAGVASFGAAESVDFTVSGLKSLTATKAITAATGAISVNSNGFTINNAAATQLAWTTHPASPTAAGSDLLPVIEVRDTYNNVVTTGVDATAAITLSVYAGTGTLNGTTTKQASGGIVSFLAAESLDFTVSGLKSLAATKVLTSGSGSFAANSNGFTITNSSATTLVWTTSPTNPTVAGNDLLPVIEIRDTHANVVTVTSDATALVTLAIATGTGGATLGGTKTLAAVAGVVTFTAAEALDLDLVGTYTLSATKADTSSGTGVGVLAANSAAFAITPAPAASLAWTTHPTNPTSAGADILVTVEVRDSFGNVVTNSADATAQITLSIASGTGSLNGTVNKQATAGVVSFLAAQSVDITVSGIKTLTATKAITGATGALAANSNLFVINNAAASQMAFTTQPVDPTAAGADLTPVIEIRDTYNNLVTTTVDATALVSLSKQSGLGTLNGTVGKQASGGIVTFTAAESVDFSQSGPKTLAATKSLTAATGAVSVNSAGFTITNSAATTLVWTTSPTDPSVAGADLSSVIEIRDTFGNVITTGVDATAAITLSVASGSGTLNGTLTKQAAVGVVSFGAAESVDFTVAGLKSLTATKAITGATGVLTAGSSAFTINNSAATTLVWSTSPTNPTIAGADLLPVIQIQDTNGNIVTTGVDATAAVTLTVLAGTGTLNGTVSKQAAAGVVSFLAAESLDFTVTGLKSLTATKAITSATGALTANSAGFTINNSTATSLSWSVQPTDPTIAAADITPTIQILDTYSNIVTTGVDATASITLSKLSGLGSLNGTVAKQASSGVVSYGAAESLDFIVAGLKTLTATKALTSGSGIIAANSNGFTINNSAATTLVWTTSPTDPTIAGVDLLPVIEIRDTNGNVVTTGVDATAAITLSVQSGSGTLNGTVTKQTSAGVVSFLAAESLDITVSGPKTLTATKAVTSATGALAANSAVFTINNAAANVLVWTVQPTDPTVAGSDLTPTIEIRDTYANVVTTTVDATAAITLSKLSGLGSLNGTLTKQASAGVVSFGAGESVDFILTGLKTLTGTKTGTSATGTIAANSAGFTITAAPATNLVYTVQPADPTIAGADISVTIEIRDTNGNVVDTGVDATALITMSKQSGSGSLNGTVTKQATAGVVSFGAAEGMDFTVTGPKTLTATKSATGATGVLTQNSNGFTINAAAATSLSWSVQPTSPTAAGADLTPTIQILDTYSNIVTTGVDATAQITLSKAAGSGTLNGTLFKQATAGVVSFGAAESVDFTAVGIKTLTATKAVTSATGALTADSSLFTIINSAATTIFWATHPTDPTAAGSDLTPVIEIHDTYGNVVTVGVDATAAITLSKQSGSGTLNGTVTKQASAGVVSYGAAESVDFTVSGPKTLTATKAVTSATGALASNSNGFTINASAATQLVFATQPVDPTVAGSDITVVVQIQDTNGNIVTTSVDATAAITISKLAGSGSLNGTVTKQTSAGSVTFGAAESLDFTVSGLKSLTATKAITAATGALSINSNGFTINNSTATTIAWNTHPANNTAAGADLTPIIEIQDTYANVVTTGVDATAAVTLTKLAGSGTLNGTVAKQATAGVINFGAAESLNFTVTGLKSLTATKAITSATGALASNSNGFTIINSTATQLSWTTSPTDPSIAGADLTSVIEIQDTYANVVTSGVDATAAITLSKLSGSGTLNGTLTKQASAGIVSFGAAESVDFVSSGLKTLTATKTITAATGALAANSAGFTIINSAATTLVWTTSPTNPSIAGADLSAVIEIRDTNGNVVTTGVDATAMVTISKAAGSGTLNGTVAKQASSGVVSFGAAESMDFTATGIKTLAATKSITSATGTLTADSALFTINNSAATQLVWSTQPTNPTPAGDDILPVIQVRDTYGNVVTTTADATAAITLSIASGTGGATLGGTKTLLAVAGVAAWTGAEGLDLDLTGTYTLSAAKSNQVPSGGVATFSASSNSFTVSPAAAASLVWTTSPTNPTTAGADLAAVVEIRDSLGNVVTSGPDSTALITISKQSGAGLLNGTVTKLAVNGVVSFAAAESMDFTASGMKTLTATKSNQVPSGGVGALAANSSGFNITNSTATSISFSTSPTNPSAAGADLSSIIEIQDTYGNVVTTAPDSTASVTLSLIGGSTGTLNGTVTKQASAGIISFGAAESVDVTTAGSKTLRATKVATGGSGSLTGDSANFVITNATATILVFTTSPTNPSAAGADLNSVIEIRDTYGNVVTTAPDSTASVTLSFTGGSTGTLNGTVTKQASAGIISFAAAESVDVTTAGSKTLRATKVATGGSGSFTGDSANFVITNAAATTVVFTTSPTNPSGAGADLSSVVEIRDTYGNVVTTAPDSTASITLSTTGGSTGTLNGTVTKQASAGTVSFGAAESVDLTVTGSKTLRATKVATGGSGSLTGDSANFVITNGTATTIVFTTSPTDPSVAGADLSSVIEIRDTYGNVVTTAPDSTASVTLSTAGGSTGTLNGTVTKQASAGIISFGAAEGVDLTVSGSKTLRATKVATGGSGSLTGDSAIFQITNAAATTVVFTTSPTDPSVAGADLSSVIEIRDTYGNVVTTAPDATASVTLALHGGSTGPLNGTVTKQASAGIISFGAGESVDITSSGAKTLRATKAATGGSGALTGDSTIFQVTNAAATTVVFTTSPTNPSAAGADLSSVIEVRDTYGNVVTTAPDSTASITLSTTGGSTGTLNGTVTKQASAGTVSFGAAESVDLTVSGSKTLRATKVATGGSGSLTGDSANFVITNNTATTIVFTTSPTNPSAAGADLSSVIEIRDTYGNVVTTAPDSTASITLSTTGGSTGTLNGTVTKQASAGTVSFAAAESVDLTVSGSKTLRATKVATGGSGSLTGDSANFVITNNTATTIVFTTSPTNPSAAGADLSSVIEIRDTYGNIVTTAPDSTASITLSTTGGSTGTLNGTVTKQASAGTVSFGAAESVDLTVSGSKTLRATKVATGGSGSLTGDSSNFVITNATATTVVFTTSPTNPSAAGADLTSVIEIRDTYGNVVTTAPDATASVTLSLIGGSTGTLNGTITKQASAGVISFGAAESADVTTAGFKTLRATKTATGGSGALTGDSSNFEITNSTATTIVFTTSPTNPSAAGADLSSVIEIRDTYGNVVTTAPDSTASITLSTTGGSTGTLNGTVTKQASAGAVSFGAAESVDLTVSGSKTLRATKVATGGSGSLTGDSANFVITNSTATTITFTTSPTDPSAAGADLSSVIEIRDTYGNVVTTAPDSTASITLSTTGGSTGTLNGTVTKQASAGTVSFGAGESVDLTVSGSKTLRATKVATGGSGSLTGDSANFVITNATATTIVFTTSPTDPSAAGADLSSVIEIRDTYGNVVTTAPDSTASITLSTTGGSTGTLNGTVTKQASAGTVSFGAAESVDLTVSGSKTLRATKVATGGSGSLTGDSANFVITNATATTIVFTTSPTNPSAAGADLSSVIEIRDTYGNVVTTAPDSTASITLSTTGGSTGTLNGTVTKQASAGTASYGAGESVDLTVTGFKTLRATKVATGGSGALTGDSTIFEIRNGPATAIVFTTSPSTTAAGDDLASVIEVRDTYANIVTTGADATASITLSLLTGSGAIAGTVTKQPTAGVVSYGAAEGVDITTAGYKTIRATKILTSASGAQTGDSASFLITNNTATTLVWTTHPANNTAAGDDLLPVIEIRDTHSNVVTVGVDATAAVTLSVQSGTGTLNGTLTKQAAAGIVSFLAAESVDFTVSGMKTLTATKAITAGSGALTANSNGFNIIASAATTLVFTTQPANPTVAGADLLPVIEIRDTNGNVVSTGVDATAMITLSTTGGSTGTLNGTVSKQASGGIVSFLAAQSVDLTVTGVKTLAATKSATSATGSLTNNSNAFTINPAAIGSFTVTGISDPTVAGTAETPVVTALDIYSNTKTDYAGTITFSSSDANVTKPANYVFVGGDNGVRTFTSGIILQTVTTTGSVTVADVSDATKNGSQTGIDVTPAAISYFTVTAISNPATAGSAYSPVVTAYDQYNNIKTNYTGTVVFSTDAASYLLPANYTFVGGDNGARTFTGGVTINSTGVYYVRAHHSADATKFGQQSSITVAPGAISYFTLTGIGNPHVRLVSQSAVVTAYDALNNVKTNYTGTVSFTSGDGAMTVPTNKTFTAPDAGIITVTGIRFVTVNSTAYLRATDTVTATALGEQINIDVLSTCDPISFLVNYYDASSNPITSVAAGTAFKVRVTARKADLSTLTCLSGSYSISWNMYGTTPGTYYCGETSGTLVSPSETTINFSSGVSDITTTAATFKFMETASVGANVGGITLSTGNITVTAGTVCKIDLRTAASNGGTAPESALLSNLGDVATMYAAGYDRWRNYNTDVAASWSGTNGVWPSPTPASTSMASAIANIIGVKVGSTGTILATFGAITDGMSITVTAGTTGTITILNTTTANDGNNTNALLGSTTIAAVHYFDATAVAPSTWRTDSTRSWYNQTMTSNIRGSRQEFPERAFIVGNVTSLDIIDATNNKLWMRLNRAAGNAIDSTYGTINRISALNSKVYVAQTAGLIILDFKNDKVYRLDSGGAFVGSITLSAGNAGTNTWSATADYSAGLATNAASDVYTRRVGTNDWLMVGSGTAAHIFKDIGSGVVARYSSPATTGSVSAVHLASDGKAYLAETGVGLHRSDLTLASLAADFTITRTYNMTTSAAKLASLTVNDISVAEGGTALEAGSPVIYAGTDKGLSIIREHSTFASSKSRTHITPETASSRNVAFESFARIDSSASGCISIPSLTVTSNNMTVEFWWRPRKAVNSGSVTMAFFTVDGVGTNNNFYMGLSQNNALGKIEATAGKGGANVAASSATTWTVGKWYWIVGEVDGGGKAVSLWIDGTRQQRTTWAPGGYGLNGTSIQFGCTETSGTRTLFTDGNVDGLRISSAAAALYGNLATITIPTAQQSGGVALYQFNDDTMLTAADSSGNSKTATIGAGVWFEDDRQLGGTSDNVTGIHVYADGTPATAQVVTSGAATGAWTELRTASEPTTITRNGTATSVDGKDVMSYHIDSLTDLDVIFGINTGGFRLRRQ